MQIHVQKMHILSQKSYLFETPGNLMYPPINSPLFDFIAVTVIIFAITIGKILERQPETVPVGLVFHDDFNVKSFDIH